MGLCYVCICCTRDHQAAQFSYFAANIWSSVHKSWVEALSGGPHLEMKATGVSKNELWTQGCSFEEQLRHPRAISFPLRSFTGPMGRERDSAACFWLLGHRNQWVFTSEPPLLALWKKKNREVSVTSFRFCFYLLEMFCVGANYHTYMIGACVYAYFSFSDYKCNAYSLENFWKIQKAKHQKQESLIRPLPIHHCSAFGFIIFPFIHLPYACHSNTQT